VGRLSEGSDCCPISEGLNQFNQLNLIYLKLNNTEKGDRKMKNMNLKLDEKTGILTITADLGKTFGPSKSGKTQIISTSEGAVSVPGKPEIRINLNIYK
jgi:hypothetical protein